MKIHLLSGFLGSGKTTLLRGAAHNIRKAGGKAAVITNDQGIRLVDTGWIEAADIPARQVTNGCFCCNYSDLDRQIDALLEAGAPDVLFAESVGSCTDIVATVFRPLRQHRPADQVTLSVVCDSLLLKMLIVEERKLFEPDVAYIYRKQIEEATLVLLNKSDLLSGPEMNILQEVLKEQFGKKIFLPLEAKREASVGEWLTALKEFPPGDGFSPDLDYDLYASGEAKMGWLDADLRIESATDAAGAAAQLMDRFHASLLQAGFPVGHVKWLIGEKNKWSMTTLSAAPTAPVFPGASPLSVLINARVQMHPAPLAALLEKAVKDTAAATDSLIETSHQAAFQPGYPRPEFRLR